LQTFGPCAVSFPSILRRWSSPVMPRRPVRTSRRVEQQGRTQGVEVALTGISASKVARHLNSCYLGRSPSSWWSMAVRSIKPSCSANTSHSPTVCGGTSCRPICRRSLRRISCGRTSRRERREIHWRRSVRRACLGGTGAPPRLPKIAWHRQCARSI